MFMYKEPYQKIVLLVTCILLRRFLQHLCWIKSVPKSLGKVKSVIHRHRPWP